MVTMVATAVADWGTVGLLFAGATGVAFFVVVITWVRWVAWRKKSRKGKPEQGWFWSSLSGLDANWTFRDSWATSLTAGSGLVLVGLGSTDVLKTVLGSDTASASAVTVATVAGAASLALVAAAGVLVLTVRKFNAHETSIVGLLAGTVVALGASGGQVLAVTWGFHGTSVGISDWVKWGAAVVACAILVAYAVSSIAQLLVQGVPAADPEPSASTATTGAEADTTASGPSTKVAASDNPTSGVPQAVHATAATIASASGSPLEHGEVLGLLQPLMDYYESQAAEPRMLHGRSALP